MNIDHHTKFTDYFGKTIHYIDLLLPPCNIDPKRLDGGNALIRIIAISCVLLLHHYSYLKPWISETKLVSSFTYCCFWAIPAFVCISGKQLPIQIPYPVFFRKKVYRILIPTIIWSIIFSLYLFFKSKYTLKEICDSYLNCCPFYHLWFMYMLCGLFILAPFCSILIKKVPFFYLIPIGFLIMLKPNVWDNPLWHYPLLLSLPYVFIFLTGGHISRLHLTKRIGLLSCFVALGYLLFMGGIPFLNIDEMSQYPFSHYLGFFSQLGGISITLSFLWLGTYFPIHTKVVLFKISQLVYGVNFIHPIIIKTSMKLIHSESINTGLFLLIFIINWFISFFIITCFKKIKFLQQIV